MRPLHRKLLRDMWKLRGQLVAIVAVVACGIAAYVTMLSVHASLRDHGAAYFERNRLPDVFARTGDAPLAVARRIEALPWVEAVEARVVENVLLDVRGLPEPAVGRLVSITTDRPPVFNEVYLRTGRMPRPGSTDEAVASEAFVALVVVAVVLSMRPEPVAVEATTVASAPMRVTVSGEGRTRAQDKYVVLAPVHGNLARIELHAGDAVEEGMVLASIEPIAPPLLDPLQRRELEARASASAAASRQAAASVARAENDARFAARELERVRALFDRGSLSRADLDTAELAAARATKEAESARFGARVARHEREMAETAVERATATAGAGTNATAGAKKKAKAGAGRQEAGAAPAEALQIRSPVAGKVLRVLRNSEGVVQPGEALLEVADLAALEIVLDVLTTDAVRISAGDDVELLRWGGEGPLHGRVRLVEPAAYTKVSALGVEEQRVDVIIDIVEPVEQRPRLGDGFALDVEVIVWRRDSALVLPLSALFRDEQGWSCYVIEGGIATPRRLEIGQRNDFEVEVLGGVSEGEQVVLHPGDRVREGALVVVAG